MCLRSLNGREYVGSCGIVLCRAVLKLDAILMVDFIGVRGMASLQLQNCAFDYFALGMSYHLLSSVHCT